MKGFVFFDLDGTLLNGESKVDKATAEAIQTLKDNGYEPFIATGRSPAETRDIMESANIHSGIFMKSFFIKASVFILQKFQLKQ